MRRKQSKPKTAQDLERHAIYRAQQRYGIFLSTEEYKNLCRSIQEQKAEFIDTESNTRTHWAVLHKGRRMRCVYFKPLGAIATFLPQEAT